MIFRPGADVLYGTATCASCSRRKGRSLLCILTGKLGRREADELLKRPRQVRLIVIARVEHRIGDRDALAQKDCRPARALPLPHVALRQPGGTQEAVA